MAISVIEIATKLMRTAVWHVAACCLFASPAGKIFCEASEQMIWQLKPKWVVKWKINYFRCGFTAPCLYSHHLLSCSNLSCNHSGEWYTLVPGVMNNKSNSACVAVFWVTLQIITLHCSWQACHHRPSWHGFTFITVLMYGNVFVWCTRSDPFIQWFT